MQETLKLITRNNYNKMNKTIFIHSKKLYSLQTLNISFKNKLRIMFEKYLIYLINII